MTRDYGEGTIRQRKDGTWEARLSLGSEGGRRRQKSFYGKTRREVQQKLADAKNQRARGEVLGSRQRLETFLEAWLETVVRPNLRLRTARDYEQIVRKHIVPKLGRYSLQEVADSTQLVQGFLTDKARSGLSPRSVEYIRAVLRAALNTAIKWNQVRFNAAAQADLPERRKRPRPTLTAEQALELLEAVREDPLEALYVLAVTTGMRQGELLGLRWSDVDLVARTISIRVSLERIGRHVALADVKTPESAAVIPLTRMGAEALLRHKERQAEGHRKAGPPWAGLVFITTRGTPVDGTNILERSFYPALERAGLPRIHFHDLRHTAASLLYAIGVPAKTVQEVLRHAHLSTTMDIYTHVRLEGMREAMDKLDGLLGS